MKMQKYTGIEGFDEGEKALLKLENRLWVEATLTAIECVNDGKHIQELMWLIDRHDGLYYGYNDFTIWPNDDACPQPTHYIRLSDIEGLGE